jgi:hypothetical protein
MQMTEQDVLHVSTHIDKLRSGSEYRKAYLLIRRSRPDITKLDKESEEFAAIRLLVGTWDQIAIFVQGFSEKQRHKLFRCQPVSLMWEFLKTAIQEIRKSVGEKYAQNFETLFKQHQAWIKSADGKDYRTAEQQAICGRFA